MLSGRCVNQAEAGCCSGRQDRQQFSTQAVNERKALKTRPFACDDCSEGLTRQDPS